MKTLILCSGAAPAARDIIESKQGARLTRGEAKLSLKSNVTPLNYGVAMCELLKIHLETT